MLRNFRLEGYINQLCQREYCDAIGLDENNQEISKDRFYGPCCSQIAQNFMLQKLDAEDWMKHKITFWKYYDYEMYLDFLKTDEDEKINFFLRRIPVEVRTPVYYSWLIKQKNYVKLNNLFES